jgi:hypothetical protein
MKSTGVGQNRQYPSTYAPLGIQPQQRDSGQSQQRDSGQSQQRDSGQSQQRDSGQSQQRDSGQPQQKDGYRHPPRYTNGNGGNSGMGGGQRNQNGSAHATGNGSYHGGGNTSYRPNRQNTSNDRHQGDNSRRNHEGGNQQRRPNYNMSATADYQPRQIQKSADLESEYSRLNRQDEMTHFVEDPGNPLSATDIATAAAASTIGSGNKQELPVLTLKNSLSKISFCDRECFNVNDNTTKEAILKYIETKYKGLNIIDNQYVLMKPHMLKNITYHEHILTTFTNGNPYLLFLTRIDNVPCSIFIDRKVKDGYCYPKIHCVQYKFANELFDNETVFTGELVRDVNRNFQYLISDLLVHNGEYIKHRNILARFQVLHSILDNEYTADPATEICPIYCKRLFQYADIKFLLKEFMPQLSYTCKGIVFHTLNNQFSDYAWIMPREKQIDVPRRHEVDAEFYRRFPEYERYRSADTNQMAYLTDAEQASGLGDGRTPGETAPPGTEAVQVHTGHSSGNRRQTFVSADALSSDPQKVMLGTSQYYIRLTEPVVLLAMKTDIPDIINLYTQDNLADKLGYAFIPNLRVSQMLYQAFKSLSTGQMTVPVSVTYHRVFNRWVPYEIATDTAHIDTNDTLERKRKTNCLSDAGSSTSETITAIGLVP